MSLGVQVAHLKPGVVYDIPTSDFVDVDLKLRSDIIKNDGILKFSHDKFSIFIRIVESEVSAIVEGNDGKWTTSPKETSESTPIRIPANYCALKFGNMTMGNVVYLVICFSKSKIERVFKLEQRLISDLDGSQEALKTQTYWAVEPPNKWDSTVKAAVVKKPEPQKIVDSVPKVVEKPNDPITEEIQEAPSLFDPIFF